MSDDEYDSSFERIKYCEEGEDFEVISVVGNQLPTDNELRGDFPRGDLPKKTKVVVELPPSMTQGKSDEAPLQEETTVKSCLSVDSNMVSISKSMIGKFQHLHAASVQEGNRDEENRTNDSDPKKGTKPATVDSRKREPRWPMVDSSTHRRKRNNSDADSFSSWNTSVGECVSIAEGGNDVTSVAASSTISGFDLISVGGSKQHACPRCTFVNENLCSVCDVCGFALEANPCLETDALLAQQMQEQENRSAFKTVERDEAERQRLLQGGSLFVQSQTLTQDILRYLEGFKKRTVARNAKTVDPTKQDIVGFEILPEHSMLILASRFIERVMKQQKESKHLGIFVRYHFLPKMNGLSLDRLRHEGFLPDSVFSVNADDALDATMDSSTYTFGAHRSVPLASIPEDRGVDEETVLRRGSEYGNPSSAQRVPLARERPFMKPVQDQMMYLGCIAAIVKGYDSRDDWKDDDTCITTIQNPSEALPLVFFDASLRNRCGILRLFSGLLRVCNDFFDPLEEPDDPLPDQNAGEPAPTSQERNRDRREAETVEPRVAEEAPARFENDTVSWHADAWMDAVAVPGVQTPERATSPMADDDTAAIRDEDLPQYFEREQRRYGAKPS
jgi:hypothetical protein